ncbi:recombination-associated protein RdgC [Tenacibaculum sp. KUL113]|nr:recombination-associated protein RdgC [Tenacibaculum sp. KUL113]
MYFKNAKIYSLTQNVDLSNLGPALEAIPFHPCGSHTLASLGFAPIIGSLLAHEVQGIYTVKLLKESKILPARVINRELEEKVKLIEAETGSPVGKKQRSDLKEQIVAQLTPRAFTDQTSTIGTIIPEHKLVFVNASSDGEAEIFLAVLRKALGSLPVVPFARRSLASDLTSWLVNGHPDKFELLEETELQATDETKAVIRAKNQELASEEIQLCLDSGKLVQKLAVSYDDQLTAMLCEDGSVKRIKYSERLIEESDDIPKDQQEARLDSEIYLGASALLDLALDLKAAFNLDADEV